MEILAYDRWPLRLFVRPDFNLNDVPAAIRTQINIEGLSPVLGELTGSDDDTQSAIAAIRQDGYCLEKRYVVAKFTEQVISVEEAQRRFGWPK